MNSTSTSNTTAKKVKPENINQNDGDNSSINKINKSSTSEYGTSQTKISNQEKLNLNEEKKQNGDSISKKSNSVGPSTTIKFQNKPNQAQKRPKRRRVQFNKNYLDVVYVESYKKYNIDVSMNGQEQSDIVRCRCLIF
jgi:hypothetical protein